MMRVAIIALILSIAALGLGGFATFTSLNDDEAALVAESGWSETACEDARDALQFPLLELECLRRQNCAPYADMLKAIADNCE